MNLTKRGQRAATLATAAILGTSLIATGYLETLAQHDTAPRHNLVTPAPNTDTCTTDADCAAAWAALDGITEDDPRWNCLTMGNRGCGPQYTALPSDLYVAIFDGVDPRDTNPVLYCMWAPDETTTVVCSDGTVVTS